MEQVSDLGVGNVRSAHSKHSKLNEEGEIEIRLNGEARQVPATLSISELLQFYQVPEQNCAVERNQRIVTKPEYADVRIKQGDQIEIVRFVGGG